MEKIEGLKCLKGIITKTVKEFLKVMPVDELTFWLDPTIMEMERIFFTLYIQYDRFKNFKLGNI